MRLSKGFTSFVGISLSCVALLISKRFIYCEMSSAVIRSKENLLFLSTVDTIFFMIEILGLFLYFFIAFSIELEMLLASHKYLSSTLVPRFGTISIKNVLKILAIWYSFFINFPSSFNVMEVLDLTLFEKRGFTVPQNFLLSVIFLVSKFS